MSAILLIRTLLIENMMTFTSDFKPEIKFNVEKYKKFLPSSERKPTEEFIHERCNFNMQSSELYS